MEEVGYKVDFDALDMLGGGINIKVNEWFEALNSLEISASTLASSGNITGTGAHNIKAYFSYVYPSVLASLRQILAAHAQNFLLYKQDYQSNIDTATHAVICQEEILDIKAQIEENKNKAAAVDTSIQNALSKVSDILYTGFRGYGSALEPSSTITRNIAELDADICALENRHVNADFEAVGQLIDNLSAFLKNQLAKTRDYKSGFSVDSLASDPSYTALAMSFGTLAQEQAAKADALELAGQQEQARIEVLQKEYEKRKKEAEAVNWLVTGLCVVGSIVAIAATGGAATPLVVAGISAVSGTVIAGTHSITGQYVQTGDLGKTDWLAVGKDAFIGGVSGFVTGYLGAGISNAVTSRLGSTVIGNTLLNSSSTVTRVATNAFIGAGAETVSGIGTRFAGTMITSGGDIKESFGSAFDVHNIAFDAAFGSVFGGVRGFKQPSNKSSYIVDSTMFPDDEAAGILRNGEYVRNPTAHNIDDYIIEGSNYLGNKNMNGQYMYVVDMDGNIVIGTRGGQRMPHPTLVGGSNPQVQAAGIVEIRGGKIYSINNASGHFKPSNECLQIAEDAFGNLPQNIFSKDFQGYLPYGK